MLQAQYNRDADVCLKGLAPLGSTAGLLGGTRSSGSSGAPISQAGSPSQTGSHLDRGVTLGVAPCEEAFVSSASVLLDSARSRMLLRFTLLSPVAAAAAFARRLRLPPRLDEPSDRALPGFDCTARPERQHTCSKMAIDREVISNLWDLITSECTGDLERQDTLMCPTFAQCRAANVNCDCRAMLPSVLTTY